MSGKRISADGVEEDYREQPDAEDGNDTLLERKNYLKLASAAVATTATSGDRITDQESSASSSE